MNLAAFEAFLKVMETGSISIAAEQLFITQITLIMAATLSLIEPTVQAFAFFFHEKVWNYF